MPNNKTNRAASGQGSIRQRADGRWEARLTLGYDEGTGKRKTLSIYGASQKEVKRKLTEKLRQLDPALSLHDLRIVPGKTHTNVLFDLVLPAGYAGDKVELLTQMEQFIKEQDPTYNCIIKLEQSYTAAAHK